MPCYDYFCEANGRTVEVRHRIHVVLRMWGEVCYAAQIPLGDTDFAAPVRKVLAPSVISAPVGNAKLKEIGFTKLVKREDGVYENVTRSGEEQRYMKRGVPSTLPDLRRKVGD